MNCFHHYAVVVIVIACNVINCEDDNDKFLNNAQFKSNESSKVKLRKKREFPAWFQIPVPIIEFVYKDDGKNGTEDADVTTTVKSGMTATAANVGAAYKNFLDAFQSSKETHIVTIGSDVNNSLVEAAPYLPLVNKLTTYIMPELSLSDVVTLSLNVAVLTTQGAADNANAQVNGDQTEPDVRNMVGQYATGMYNKLKDAFKSHFGHITNYFSDGEKNESSTETHSVFDQLKKKMNIFGSFINEVDAPEIENKENQTETIVIQTCIEGSQTPINTTIVTKTYERGVESIHQATNGEKGVISTNKLLKNGNYKVDKIITEMKDELISDDSLENVTDFESFYDDNSDENMDDDEEKTSYGDDGIMYDDVENLNDDDDDNTIDDNVEIKEDDFNKVMQESMVLQPDFVNTLDGEELLKRIEDLQKSLPNPNPNSRKTFKAVTEELGIDEQYSSDYVNELINVLEIITNYFIVKAIETNGLLTTPSTSPTSPAMD